VKIRGEISALYQTKDNKAADSPHRAIPRQGELARIGRRGGNWGSLGSSAAILKQIFAGVSRRDRPNYP
jgi:hypothetical protein